MGAMTLRLTGHSRWEQQQISVSLEDENATWWQNVFTGNCRFHFSKPEGIVERQPVQICLQNQCIFVYGALGTKQVVY